MKLLIILCLFVTLCCAGEKVLDLNLNPNIVVNQAFQIMKESKNLIQETMLDVGRRKKNMRVEIGDEIRNLYRQDAIPISETRDMHIEHINQILVEAEASANINAVKCLNSTAENIKSVVRDAHRKVVECQDAAFQKMEKALARYDEVMTLGETLSNEPIAKECHNIDEERMALCIINRVLVIEPKFTRFSMTTHNEIKAMKDIILAEQKHCNDGPITKAHSASVDTIYMIDKCMQENNDEHIRNEL